MLSKQSSIVALASWMLLTAGSPAVEAFAPVAHPTTRAPSSTTAVSATSPSDNDNNNSNQQHREWFGSKAVTSALVAATLWATPLTTTTTSNNHFGPSVLDTAVVSSVASAKEMASGTGSRVNKDADSLLRYGLPINNKEVRKLQTTLETIKYDILSKRKAAALDGAKVAVKQMKSDEAKYKASCRDATICQDLLTAMVADMDPLSEAIKASMDSPQGSEQERAAIDKAYAAQKQVVDKLSALEEQMIPDGYKTPIPAEYSDLPHLEGRATVEMVIQKAGGENFDVNGETFPEAKLTMVIDGYTAPVTGGNFVELVQKGFYTKMPIQRSDGFVVQTGDPDGEAEGYVAPGSKSVGNGKHGERLIPLEIFVKGDKGPFYETTIEDEGRGGQATVLPFSSYGAMGWAREEYDANSGSSQFFWLLFDSDLTPAGKNVLDGRYPCFGYVTEGADFLQDIKEGDVIVSSKVTAGQENLVLPKE